MAKDMIQFCGMLIEDYEGVSLLESSKKEIKIKLTHIQKLFKFNEKVHLYFFDTCINLSKHIGHNLPDWVKGISFDKCIYLVKKEGWVSDLEDSLIDILIHEYVHVAVVNTFSTPCPIWLNEGLATVFSGQADKIKTQEYKRGYSYYESGYEDGMLYLQSTYIVKKLIYNFGEGFIVESAKQCLDFINDPIFGADNLDAIA